MGKRILILLHECPYPIIGGGQVDFYYKLKYLVEFGYDVSMIFTYSRSEDYQKFLKRADDLCSRHLAFPRKKNIVSLLSLVPYFIQSSKPDRKEKERIQSFLNEYNKTPDVIIVDHLNAHLLGQYVMGIFPGVPAVYRMHNRETVFLFSVFRTFGFLNIKKWLFGLDAIKMHFYEEKARKKYSSIAGISLGETNHLKDKGFHDNIVWVPPFFDYRADKEIELNGDETKIYDELCRLVGENKMMLLAGNFNSGFNVKKTKWFIDAVLPLIRERFPAVKLVVVGFYSEKYFRSDDHVIVRPFFQSINPYMKRADLAVIVSTGKGGVKLKLMDALNYRKPIVSTVDGLYGSSFKNLLPGSDSPEEFSEMCCKALCNEIDYSPAYDYFETDFNPVENVTKLLGV